MECITCPGKKANGITCPECDFDYCSIDCRASDTLHRYICSRDWTIRMSKLLKLIQKCMFQNDITGRFLVVDKKNNICDRCYAWQRPISIVSNPRARYCMICSQSYVESRSYPFGVRLCFKRSANIPLCDTCERAMILNSPLSSHAYDNITKDNVSDLTIVPANPHLCTHLFCDESCLPIATCFKITMEFAACVMWLDILPRDVLGYIFVMVSHQCKIIPFECRS